jgi:hypothetical protein
MVHTENTRDAYLLDSGHTFSNNGIRTMFEQLAGVDTILHSTSAAYLLLLIAHNPEK